MCVENIFVPCDVGKLAINSPYYPARENEGVTGAFVYLQGTVDEDSVMVLIY